MTASLSTSIRPAGEQDLEFVVWAMRTAATSHLDRSVWDTLLGLPSREVDATFAATATGPTPHWCHLSRFLVAEAEGVPVGTIVGFDTATEGSAQLEQALTAEVVARGPEEAALLGMIERAEALRAGTPDDVPGTWGLENVAVVPAARGRGVVDDLLVYAMAEGRERGYREAQILCLEGNGRAERTWRRHGFAPRDRCRDQRFADVFGPGGITLLHRTL